jgi:hypothetical protein
MPHSNHTKFHLDKIDTRMPVNTKTDVQSRASSQASALLQKSHWLTLRQKYDKVPSSISLEGQALSQEHNPLSGAVKRCASRKRVGAGLPGSESLAVADSQSKTVWSGGERAGGSPICARLRLTGSGAATKAIIGWSIARRWPARRALSRSVSGRGTSAGLRSSCSSWCWARGCSRRAATSARGSLAPSHGRSGRCQPQPRLWTSSGSDPAQARQHQNRASLRRLDPTLRIGSQQAASL